jgi:PAN domain
VGEDYVPEGKPERQAGISTVENCQATCALKDRCKAYAFQTSRPACYFYSRVFMGGTYDGRQAEIYSAGLAIRPKKGFVSGFKRSSFPERPAMIQHPN